VALILLAIGVQIMISGLQEVVGNIILHPAAAAR
jgi:small neutral amino acid transporter SnatA (MarC family)